MTENELKNRLNMEITRRTHMQREIEKVQEENYLLKEKLAEHEQKIQSLQQRNLEYFKEAEKLEEQYRSRLEELEAEKLELMLAVEELREELKIRKKSQT